MLNIWKLIVIAHRRKKHILGLIIVLFVVALCLPILDSIALGQGDIVNQSFQHLIIEVVGLLFLVYFGSTLLHQFSENKTLQLLWSKKKQPLSFITGAWLGLYTIYAGFVMIALLASLLYYGDTAIIISYGNLLISGSIALSFIFLFSCVTNSYAAMLSSLIIYIISYSINFIIFSTPISFEGNISFKILSLIQYLFPRFDILYSTMQDPSARGWTVIGNLFYLVCVSIIMVRVFLSRFSHR